MVNTGRPSRDCESCRHRRVKCDLNRPTCRRCQKSGRSCAYRNLDDPQVLFRIHTPASYNDRKQPNRRQERTKDAGKRATEFSNQQLTRTSPVRLSALDQEDRSESLSPFSESPALPGQIVETWDTHIIPFIVDQFSFPSTNGGRIYASLECFPNILRKSEPGSVLQMTCNAVGSIYKANRSPSNESVISHQRMYGNALQQLQVALSNPKTRNQDDILLSVWLLCLYELMLGTPSSSKGPMNWGVHSKALTELLRSRGQQQFRTKTGRQLFQLSYHYIQIQSLLTGSGPAPEAREWFDAMKSSADGKEYIFMPSFDCGDQAARIFKNATSSFDQANSAAEQLAAIENTFQACKALERSMQKPLNDFLSSFIFGTPVDLPAKENESKSVLRIRNHHDTCMLRLYSILLELILQATSQPDISNESVGRLIELQQACVEESQFCICRILGALPQFLTTGHELNLPTWADTLRLLWPLRGILCSPAAQETQRWMAKAALRTIAYEGGIMQAVGSFFSNITIYESP